MIWEGEEAANWVLKERMEKEASGSGSGGTQTKGITSKRKSERTIMRMRKSVAIEEQQDERFEFH